MLYELKNGVRLNYEAYGQGPRLVLLHGWGADSHIFDPITPKLASHFQVIAPDLPGFGLSPISQHTRDLSGYAETIGNFLNELEIGRYFLLGHSFGGAVAVKLASMATGIEKLILVDSSGIRNKPPLVRAKIIAYKAAKSLLPEALLNPLRKLLGSDDYQNAGALRQTFLKIINADIQKDLAAVNVPTLLIWGEEDRDTPLDQARLFSRLIPDANLKTIKDCGHFPFLDQPDAFITTVIDFIKNR